MKAVPSATAAGRGRRRAGRALDVINAITYFYLGAAALTIPHHDGSWGVTGGVLALLGGAGFLAATIYEARRQARAPAADVALPCVAPRPALLLAAKCREHADDDGGGDDVHRDER